MTAALYEDDEILVIDKPAGLASQPGEGVRISLIEAVERDFGFRPFPVHRLDKETSGCVLVARTREAAARWSRLVESRELAKTYRALVRGRPEGARGRFDEAVPTRTGPKEASTSWRLLGAFAEGAGGPYSYLELELGTGRTHEIRLHLAGRALPILGDDRHGDFALNKRLRRSSGLRRLMLHARSLRLPGGLVVTSPMPERFGAFLALFPGAPDPETP